MKKPFTTGDIYEFAASPANLGPMGIKGQNTIPIEFALGQNYPNPFNPDTRITFSLAHKAPTLFRIYDVVGREVRTLLDDILGEGSYSVLWDGLDNASSSAASGVYFYRLQSGNYVATKKMMLLR